MRSSTQKLRPGSPSRFIHWDLKIRERLRMSRGMKMIKRAAKCYIVVKWTLFVALAAAQQPVRLWSVSMLADPAFERSQRAATLGMRPSQIEFLSSDKLVIAFDDAPAIHIGDEAGRPFNFHVLSVAVQTGVVERFLTFPVTSDTSAIGVTATGDLLVLAGEEMAKYSERFTKLARYETKLTLHGKPSRVDYSDRSFLSDLGEFWKLNVGPGGKTLLLQHKNAPMRGEFLWLSSADFTEKHHKSMNHWDWDQIDSGDDTALLSNPLEGQSVEVGGREDRAICRECRGAYFLSNDRFLIDKGKHYEIVEASGKKLIRGPLFVNVATFARSLRSARYAFATGAYKGFGFPLVTEFRSIRTEIVIRELSSAHNIGSIKLTTEIKGTSLGVHFPIALSPDGKLLAVLNGDRLECFKLP